MFAKLMAICLIIPDNYLLKSHASAYQQSNKWIKAYEKRIVIPALKSFFGFIIQDPRSKPQCLPKLAPFVYKTTSLQPQLLLTEVALNLLETWKEVSFSTF